MYVRDVSVPDVEEGSTRDQPAAFNEGLRVAGQAPSGDEHQQGHAHTRARLFLLRLCIVTCTEDMCNLSSSVARSSLLSHTYSST